MNINENAAYQNLQASAQAALREIYSFKYLSEGKKKECLT